MRIAPGAPIATSTGALARLGARLAGPRELLSIAFPGVAYAGADAGLTEAVTGFAPGTALARRRYLELWGRHVDVNFVMPPAPSSRVARPAEAPA